MMRVYVLNMHGHPMMPCTPRKARLLLKQDRAFVVKRTPFTIQLKFGSSGYKQPVVLGVDAGSKIVGLAATTKDEELFSAELTPRNDVVDLLSSRRELRRSRRNRTTRYRKPRFDNRTRVKHRGWLAPSVEVKIQEHITAIKRVCRILPISKVVVETAEFDLQLIKAVQDGKPVPEGEDYQKGEMLGYYNVRQYVFHRDGYTCQCCGAHGKGIKLHAHHIESRKVGGNAPDNLITACDMCHEKHHKGIDSILNLAKRRRHSMRDAAFMGIMRKTLIRRLQEELDIPVCETHGYVTKYVRTELLKLPKSHTNDALAISAGRGGHGIKTSHTFNHVGKLFQICPVRHHNRKLHKNTILRGGIRKRNQATTYVKGFRLYDKVVYNGKECFVWGRRMSGSFLLRQIDYSLVKDGASWKKLKLLERSSNYIIA